MKSEYSLLIDWLTITGNWYDWQEMFDFLGFTNPDVISQFEKCNGQDFYQYGLVYRAENKRAISFNACNANSPDNSEIRLSGKGCRVFKKFIKRNVRKFLENTTTFTRQPNFTIVR